MIDHLIQALKGAKPKLRCTDNEPQRLRTKAGAPRLQELNEEYYVS